MAANTPENKVKASIKKYLEDDHWMIQSNAQFGPYVVPGRPDMEAYKNGKVIFIEVKSKTGRQSDWQKAYQKKLEEHGMIYILARSVDDLKPYLDEIQFLF